MIQQLCVATYGVEISECFFNGQNLNSLLGYSEQFFNLSLGQTSELQRILLAMIQSESFDGAELHIPAPHFNSTSCLCSNKPTGGVVDDDRPPNLDEDSDTEPSAGTKRA